MVSRPAIVPEKSLQDPDYQQKMIKEIQDSTQNHLIPNTPTIDVRFTKPVPVNYSILGSVFSILSLILMSVLSVGMFMNLTGSSKNFPGNLIADFVKPFSPSQTTSWVWLPFLFTIIGSTVGWIFELGLLVTGKPFQQNLNKFTVFIQKIRFLNLSPVVCTIWFFVCTIVIADPNIRIASLFLAVAGTSGLGTALFFGGAWAVPLILLGLQVVQVAIVIFSATPTGGNIVSYFLIAQGLAQFFALIIGTSNPLKSTLFHTISTLSGVFLFLAIVKVIGANPDFAISVAPNIPPGSLQMWLLLAVFIAGVRTTMKISPMTYNSWRAGASNAVWSLQYFLLISAKRFSNPFNLSFVYKNGAPNVAKTKPYYQQHPEYLPEALSIPAVEKIEKNVLVYSDLLKKVKKSFAVIAKLDHFFPQADLKVPLKNKPRMNIWSSGLDIYPRIYQMNLFGYTVPGRTLEKTPDSAIRNFRKGQLLAYLAESGVANTFLSIIPGTDKAGLKLDFRYLEKYETKMDYESYGGMAFFCINEEKQCLELNSVIAPNSDIKILADPDSPSFRHAEALILASLYYQVISGKHLTEIHMTYNLVEVGLHNAFDARNQFNHPVRTLMYLHLFSHELAEELTTEHLVQEGAVFSQIFATTHDSLINHLNDTYQNFKYGTDENFEDRKAVMTMKNGEILPNACIKWELKYAEIWQNYTDKMINHIYIDDKAVQDDTYLQDLYCGLNEMLLQGLPERYDKFQTRTGVSRWASDTIHHLVVRHQVYGTTGVKASLDPRISNTQVPKDGGTPGVDEWRSLLGVALATARARFVLLKGSSTKFVYLLEGVDQRYVPEMTLAFEQLQVDLEKLETEWTADSSETNFNYNYFRPIPSELHSGAGY